MRAARLDHMIKGWFVGDFDPVIFRTKAVEVAVKFYKAGDKEELHHHRVATEVTTIISGRVRMYGQIWSDGDIVMLEPGEASEFEAITDVISVVVKLPSATGDKYLGLSSF